MLLSGAYYSTVPPHSTILQDSRPCYRAEMWHDHHSRIPHQGKVSSEPIILAVLLAAEEKDARVRPEPPPPLIL